MENSFMNNLVSETNYERTENGALAYKSTRSAILDMFALCGAYRERSDEDCITMFKNALAESEPLALRCLFYLRDIRGGQGERRFFRVCFHWLCDHNPAAAIRNLDKVSEYGRWDDLIYAAVGTKCEMDAFRIIKHQLALDVTCKTPSLLGKWMPSENASSQATKAMAAALRKYLRMSHKEYRKMLSVLRTRINIVEKLMSENRWNEIQFDAIPSKAGLIYKNAFARRDIIAKKYETFAKDENAKVNAATLYPYEIVKKAISFAYDDPSETDIAMLEKYWNNQIDVLEGQPCKMLCVCDTSGSMMGTPINVAIGLSMYCAERIGGPFKNHYISFSSRPQLIKIEGANFIDKVRRIYSTNLCENTDIEATFDLLLKVARESKKEDIPDTIVIISDMEIDAMTGPYWYSERSNQKRWTEDTAETEMEKIRSKWEASGLDCPRLVYWNVNARNNTILDAGENVSFVSGFSPMIFKQILIGKNGMDLCLDVLMSKRYSCIK